MARSSVTLCTRVSQAIFFASGWKFSKGERTIEGEEQEFCFPDFCREKLFFILVLSNKCFLFFHSRFVF